MNPEAKTCYSACIDTLFERVKCSNPECDNYAVGFWLDEKGQCMDCQIKEVKENALAGFMATLD